MVDVGERSFLVDVDLKLLGRRRPDRHFLGIGGTGPVDLIEVVLVVVQFLHGRHGIDLVLARLHEIVGADDGRDRYARDGKVGARRVVFGVLSADAGIRRQREGASNGSRNGIGRFGERSASRFHDGSVLGDSPRDSRFEREFLQTDLVRGTFHGRIVGDPVDGGLLDIASRRKADEFEGDGGAGAGDFDAVGLRPIDLFALRRFDLRAAVFRTDGVARGPGRPGKGGEEEERGWAESGHGST